MRYPLALYQPRHRDLDLVTESNWLQGQSPDNLDLGYFEDLRIIDSDGFEERVKSARVTRERRRLFGLKREYDLALEFTGSKRRIPLSELAALVHEAVDSDSSLWEYREDVSSAVEFKQILDDAQSHEELIRLLDGGL